MDKERYAMLTAMIGEAVELPPSERDAFLVSRCGDDEALLAAACELLAAHLDSGAFLERPFLESLVDASLDDDALIAELDDISGYRVLEKLGEGGMGLVFRARQQAEVEREVALKVIRFGDQTTIERFAYERNALARLSHPNIARIFEAGTTASGRPYFTMELVKGREITRWATETGADLAERLEVFLDVCDGVLHAHQRGIIHRDLKPSNILVTEINGRPIAKIIDFGIARAVDPAVWSDHTRAGQVLGTPAFMAPEQVEPETLGIDTRTDVYGLGALLFALLTGRPPFDPDRLNGLSRTETMRVILEEDPPLASHTAPSDGPVRARTLRGDLDRITAKALARDKALRYSGAGELAADIRRHLAGEPVQARPSSAGYVLGKLMRRHRGPAIAFMAGLLALIAFAATLQVKNAEIKRQTKIAEDNRTFLGNLLKQGRQWEGGPGITMLGILERTEPELAGIPEDQRVGLIPFYAEAYRESYQMERAERLYEALRHLTEEHAKRRPSYLDALIGLARIAEVVRDHDRGRTLIETARPVAEAVADPVRTLILDRLEANLLLNQRQPNEAVATLERSLSEHERQLGPNHMSILISRRELGRALRETGQTARAIEVLREALQRTEKMKGTDHLESLETRLELANAEKAHGALGDALESYAIVFRAHRDIMGPTYPRALTARVNMIRVLLDMNDPDRAQGLIDEVLALFPGDSDIQQVLIARGLAALVARRQGRGPEAVAMLDELFPRFCQAFGLSDGETLRLVNNRANIEKGWDEASAAADIQLVLEQLPADAINLVDVLILRVTLGEILFETEENQAALAYFEKLYADVQKLPQPGPSFKPYITGYTGILRHRNGDPTGKAMMEEILRRGKPEDLCELIRKELEEKEP